MGLTGMFGAAGGGASGGGMSPEGIRDTMLAGSAITSGGQVLSGIFAGQASRYQARVSEWQAQDAIERGREAENQHRLAVRRLVGAQRVSFAAQGVDVNDGSALDVQLDTVRHGTADAIRIRNNAAREAWGYRNRASVQRQQGGMAVAEGVGSAGGTLLGGAVNAQRVYNRIR